MSPKATEGECATCVFLLFSVLAKVRDRHFLKLKTITESLKQKIRFRIHRRANPRLSATFQSRGLLPSRSRVTPSSRRKATVEELRHHRFSSCQIYTKIHSQLHSIKPHPFRTSNTPQSSAATAPLLKRGQPIGDRLRCAKEKTGGQPVTNDLSRNILFQLCVENFVENTIRDCDFS